VLVLDMIEILRPLGKYKYDTWRILPMKCYIDNFMRLQSCIRNINRHLIRDPPNITREVVLQTMAEDTAEARTQ
jgi:hypothetical protein